MEPCVLLLGTGAFAGRILLDLAATAREPVLVRVAGRNAERVAWLTEAARARARIFETAARFEPVAVDVADDGALEDLLGRGAAVVVQAASAQPSSVIARADDAWSALVAEGGLSTTAVIQAYLTSRVAAAITRLGSAIPLINCCFPDVVNGLVTAQGHKVLCGTGNVAILSSVFASHLRPEDAGATLRVLAHYQTIGPWRQPAAARRGPVPRVFLDDREIADVLPYFAGARLTPEPVIEVSGAAGVPLILALAAGRDWRGHAPGPNGLPGGYPVLLHGTEMALDLPAGVSEPEAIAWNAGFEEENGLVVDAGGTARFTGALRDALRRHSSPLAEGFAASDLEAAHGELTDLRDRLS